MSNSMTPTPSASTSKAKKRILNRPSWDDTTTFGSSLGVSHNSPTAASGSGGGELVPYGGDEGDAASGDQDPSIALRLAGTYVPLRLVRLTEEIRFRESCRRIALARARLEDLHDFKLLMKREKKFF